MAASSLRKRGKKGFSRILFIIATIGVLAGGIYFYATQLLWEQPPAVEDDTSHLPFKVVDLPGKGKGVIATRDIHQGELILGEKPIFVVPSKVSTSPGALLLHSLAMLTPSQRESFYNLSYVNLPPDVEPDTTEYNEQLALAIFQTNAIHAGDNVGIFPRMARFNHGCSSAFNSVYTWRSDEGGIVVYALRSIKKGQELLTTYTNTKRPRNDRRRHLSTHYGFECQCSVCSLPDNESMESDLRLMRMSDLRAHLATWGEGSIPGKEVTKAARQIWSIGEEEGYWSERGSLAADASWVAAAHSDVKATQEWAELALKWYTIEIGGDSEQVKEMTRVASLPMRHKAWGTRAEEQVGGTESLT